MLPGVEVYLAEFRNYKLKQNNVFKLNTRKISNCTMGFLSKLSSFLAFTIVAALALFATPSFAYKACRIFCNPVFGSNYVAAGCYSGSCSCKDLPLYQRITCANGKTTKLYKSTCRAEYTTNGSNIWKKC